MQAGSLRHRVSIENPVDTQDSTGAPIPTWESVAEDLPASIQPLTGRELFAAQQVQSDTTTKITIRWIKGVTSRMRVLHSLGESPEVVEVYNIEAVLPDSTGRRTLQLLCRLRAAEGFRSDG